MNTIALDFEKANYPGIDNMIVSNIMTNTAGRAISVWGCYQNFTIKDNYVDNASVGIWIFDNTFGDISNGIVTNNILTFLIYFSLYLIKYFLAKYIIHW